MKWDVVAHGYGLVEAPTIDVDGSLVFSDVLGGGIAIHADGGIVCSGRDLVHVRDGATRTVLHVDGVAGWNASAPAQPDASTRARCASRCSTLMPKPYPVSSASRARRRCPRRDFYVTTGGNSGDRDLRGCVLHTTVDVAGAPVAPARV
jgi:hypothetical protein